MSQNQSSFLWYDFETFGVDPRRDRPVQFAAIRTDMDLNVIDDPIDIFCRPTMDCVPDPEACLITGISPLVADKKGLSEKDFADKIFQEMSSPNTCTLGYNTIRFDDEVTRFMFYRNLMDPYEREWKMGNSRWDLLDVVRMTWALKPESLKWPLKETGQVSFKLDQLTQVNDIGHENAHDALSDVWATIALAKKIKRAQPELFKYAFDLRLKASVDKKLDLSTRKPVLHISGRFPVDQGCMAVVSPIMRLPDNPNGVICFNLNQSPDLLQELTVEEIQQRLFSSRAQLEEQGIERLGIKVIHLNKSPMVVPVAMLTPEIANSFGHDIEKIRQHYDMIKKMPDISHKLLQVFQREYESDSDVDVMLYDGFIPNADRQKLNDIRQIPPFSQDISSFNLKDTRLPELIFRFWCRNWPDKIPESMSAEWLHHCEQSLTRSDYGSPRNIHEVEEKLLELKQYHPEKVQLLDDIGNFLVLQKQRAAIF